MEQYLKEIDAWVWTYLENTRNYDGLHLTARQPACDALLRCLDVLEAEGPGARRTATLQALDPRDEEKVSGGQRFADYRRLTLSLVAPSDEMQQFYVGTEGDRVTLEFTPGELHLLREGLLDVRRGVGDYSIGPETRGVPAGRRDRDSLCLWFWPCFGHFSPIP